MFHSWKRCRVNGCEDCCQCNEACECEGRYPQECVSWMTVGDIRDMLKYCDENQRIVFRVDDTGFLGLDRFSFGAAITGFLPVKYNTNQYTYTEHKNGGNYPPDGFESAIVLELIDPNNDGFVDQDFRN